MRDLEGAAGLEALHEYGESRRAITRLTTDMRALLLELWEREEAGDRDAWVRRQSKTGSGWTLRRSTKVFAVATINALWGDGYLAQVPGPGSVRYQLTDTGRALAERIDAEEDHG